MSQQERKSNGPSDVTNGANDAPATDGERKRAHDDCEKTDKRARTEEEPSRVVHIRSIPNDANEKELIYLGLLFGRISNILRVRNKNQAFIEFVDEDSARSMVEYFRINSVCLRGHTLLVEYSKHKELKVENDQATEEALLDMQFQFKRLIATATKQPRPNENELTPVLRVVVDKMYSHVTLKSLHVILSKIGDVQKIITFNKNNVFQALVQYDDVATAQTAKLLLGPRNHYNDECDLVLDYSHLNQLRIRYNNDKSFDFTNPSLPSGDNQFDPAQAFRAPMNNHMPPPPLVGNFPPFLPDPPMHMRNMPPMRNSQRESSVLLISGLAEDEVSPDDLCTLFGVYGNVQRVKILYKKKDHALIQMQDFDQAQAAMRNLDRLKLHGKELHVTQSRLDEVPMPREGIPDAGLTRDYMRSNVRRFRRTNRTICPPSATLHLANLPSSVTENDLRELFNGTGGSVQGFRYLNDEHRMALIEMGNEEEATLALMKLHNYLIGEKVSLCVSYAKKSI